MFCLDKFIKNHTKKENVSASCMCFNYIAEPPFPEVFQVPHLLMLRISEEYF